ncbi:heme o synthase [Corynebacterium sp. CCM 8835]|uniref:Protoheme IX farnesyltransferase n=1 Tax=Corynebacterium antarcticum TaxID=2800405 RepID=A0A9Q4C9Y3_9CORY|nr:heme o synthase [Corynebacterium antarcticum]MCK7641464.1 heme o synthase [Corynebacterium antarcticum]MCK7660438.1 heme o synthase [Corynebacterium antarcticum]MCL0244692.1 heme o synthase [Corynebacterium antarcticum]MCX7491065.1 heme o synthase [Corynebacterium antarcticum]MCX7537090.1 heme o synthase [Corynebacterium antarcticum]
METIKAYLALTKPRVIELLLVATIPAMLQADRGENHVGLILLTVIGGWMGAAAANTFNMVADSDIDKVMKRTERRPLAKMVVTNRNATIFAWTLTVVSFLWLWLLCRSLLAALFVMATIAFYIFVYTKWLKRRTPQNVVWGGAAGCMPVVVGWAVITDNLPVGVPPQWWQAIVLFLIIFFWTPPHTWALAMRYKEDYRAAGVPMMPVVRTEAQVTLQIVLYTWATVITTFLLIPAAGFIYAAVAVAAGAWFIIMAHLLHRAVLRGVEVKPLKLFILSNNYLAAVFVALSLDAFFGLETVGQMLGISTTVF